MGTHPIFESDFDCLTDRLKYGRIQIYERNLAQKAIGNDALLATDSRLAIPKLERHPSGFTTNSTRKSSTIGLQSNSGICCIQERMLLLSHSHMMAISELRNVSGGLSADSISVASSRRAI